MFKINDYVVYKKDVCKISNIKEYSGKKYYVLTPVEDETLKINVPVDNELIRATLSKDEALKVIDLIKNVKVIEIDNEKNLEQEYKELIKTGKYEGLISIIKTTYLRNQSRILEKKKISEVDQRYFVIAENKLYDELAIPLNMTKDEVKEFIFAKLEKK